MISVSRNIRGDDRLFVGIRHPSYTFFEGLYEGEMVPDVSIKIKKGICINCSECFQHINLNKFCSEYV